MTDETEYIKLEIAEKIGKYLVDKLLGEGGYGRVFLANSVSIAENSTCWGTSPIFQSLTSIGIAHGSFVHSMQSTVACSSTSSVALARLSGG